MDRRRSTHSNRASGGPPHEVLDFAHAIPCKADARCTAPMRLPARRLPPRPHDHDHPPDRPDQRARHPQESIDAVMGSPPDEPGTSQVDTHAGGMTPTTMRRTNLAGALTWPRTRPLRRPAGPARPAIRPASSPLRELDAP